MGLVITGLPPRPFLPEGPSVLVQAAKGAPAHLPEPLDGLCQICNLKPWYLRGVEAVGLRHYACEVCFGQRAKQHGRFRDSHAGVF